MSELTHDPKLFHHRPLGKKYNDEEQMTNDEARIKSEIRMGSACVSRAVSCGLAGHYFANRRSRIIYK
jgi:hypothetical protein